MTQETHEDAVSFFWVDVFTDRPLHGNPVAVVPDADRLDEETMRRIAREFNQSETTFAMRPTRAEADWRLRSFTPAGEEAFGAGHNTLGAWWWLAESGALALGESGASLTQEVGRELLAVHVTCDSGRVTAVGMSQAPPEFGAVCDDRDGLAGALALSIGDLAPGGLSSWRISSRAMAPRWISNRVTRWGGRVSSA